MRSNRTSDYEHQLDVAQLYLNRAHKTLLSNYHPWQRYKRTVAMVGFFNVLFGPTVFGVIGQYKPEWLIAVEEAVGAKTLIFFPILSTIIIPALIGFLEAGLKYRFDKTVMPEPDVQDRIPFVVSLPGLEKLSHLVIGDSLSLMRKQVISLLVLGTAFQVLQATIHTKNPTEQTILDFLFHDPIFTFVGQFFVFGKLVPKLFSLLPRNKTLEEVGNTLDQKGYRLFECFKPKLESDDAYAALELDI